MTDQTSQEGDLILYRTAADTERVDALSASETFWLDQRRLVELFDVEVRTVSEHLRNVNGDGELNDEATIRKIRTVRTKGSREASNLDYVRPPTAHTARLLKERRAAGIAAAVAGRIDVGESAV